MGVEIFSEFKGQSSVRMTCRIVTPNLNGVIIIQVESYRVTIVQVVNIFLNYTIQDIISSIQTNLWRKNSEAGNSLNAVEHEPVPTRVLNPTASEVRLQAETT